MFAGRSAANAGDANQRLDDGRSLAMNGLHIFWASIGKVGICKATN